MLMNVIKTLEILAIKKVLQVYVKPKNIFSQNIFSYFESSFQTSLSLAPSLTNPTIIPYQGPGCIFTRTHSPSLSSLIF